MTPLSSKYAQDKTVLCANVTKTTGAEAEPNPSQYNVERPLDDALQRRHNTFVEITKERKQAD